MAMAAIFKALIDRTPCRPASALSGGGCPRELLDQRLDAVFRVATAGLRVGEAVLQEPLAIVDVEPQLRQRVGLAEAERGSFHPGTTHRCGGDRDQRRLQLRVGALDLGLAL